MFDVTNYFWDYAKNIMKVASLEETFLNWVDTNKIDYNVAKNVWAIVNDEIKTAFDTVKNPGSASGSGTSVSNIPPSPMGLGAGVNTTNTESQNIKMEPSVGILDVLKDKDKKLEESVV